MPLNDSGELEIDCINAMNVPVTIFIEEENSKWILTAGNYMPRRGKITGDAYRVESDTQEELVQMVQDKIVPLYEAALNNLKKYGTNYYWEPVIS